MNRKLLLDKLVRYFVDENNHIGSIEIPKGYGGQRRLLRALMNIRLPKGIDSSILQMQDEFLSGEIRNKGIIDPYKLLTVKEQFSKKGSSMMEKIVLWRGDITTIGTDAIVNAANSKMLGCFIPNHKCVDNAIHSVAGIELRLACEQIMTKQSRDESIGSAKITKGYNLPSKYVVHTVGPIIQEKVAEADSEALASCYQSCLEVAKEQGDIRTIAFCCISTGEYRFPKAAAAKIAVDTVSKWIRKYPDSFDRIVFNVFTKEDNDEYGKLLK